jgi:hypothetical protein
LCFLSFESARNPQQHYWRDGVGEKNIVALLTIRILKSNETWFPSYPEFWILLKITHPFLPWHIPNPRVYLMLYHNSWGFRNTGIQATKIQHLKHLACSHLWHLFWQFQSHHPTCLENIFHAMCTMPWLWGEITNCPFCPCFHHVNCW